MIYTLKLTHKLEGKLKGVPVRFYDFRMKEESFQNC
jgi:hypothetical protein